MTAKERRFVEVVRNYYSESGRKSLPWRKTRNAYRILVSEIMLQQTQVERVTGKYKEFIHRFPTIQSLAAASLGEVLKEWQGLGYNRRAKMLHACAQIVARKYEGRLPKQQERLIELPGIGAYTASAICAFAYNMPVVLIETNVRSVFIHHFFHDDTDVHDKDIQTLVARTLDHANPREWYGALMDYGTYIKKTFGNPNSRSKHYAPQSAFQGSDRQIRGAILRILSVKSALLRTLHTELGFDSGRIDAQLARLTEEGLIIYKRQRYALPA